VTQEDPGWGDGGRMIALFLLTPQRRCAQFIWLLRSPCQGLHDANQETRRAKQHYQYGKLVSRRRRSSCRIQMEHAAPRKKDKQNEDGHNPADAQQHETGTSKVKNQAVGALSAASRNQPLRVTRVVQSRSKQETKRKHTNSELRRPVVSRRGARLPLQSDPARKDSETWLPTSHRCSTTKHKGGACRKGPAESTDIGARRMQRAAVAPTSLAAKNRHAASTGTGPGKHAPEAAPQQRHAPPVV